jgi:hypothetical protein
MNDSGGMSMNDPEMTINGDMPMTNDKTGEGSMSMQDSGNKPASSGILSIR